MRSVPWKLFLIGAFLTNFIIAIIMWSYLDMQCECTNYKIKHSSYLSEISVKHSNEKNDSYSQLSKNTIVIIREFEYFENDIINSINSLIEVMPLVKVLIISDKIPYPPLHISDEIKTNVQIVSLKTSIYKSQFLCLFELIDREHVLILPDSVRFDNLSQIVDVFEFHKKNPKSMLAIPFVDEKYECLNLNVSMRYWTIKYRKSTDNFYCNAIEGKHVLFLTKTLLQLLSYPFTRPFPNSLFIQAALHKIMVEVIKGKYFRNGKKLFTDSHNKWKHDFLHQERKREMYKTFGIKKILYPASKVEWHGCSKNTERCFGTVINNMPEYLFEGKWTPPCCLENLRQTARYVFGILEKCDVRYWLEGGSLLGAARNGDIIPWDYDIDIGIYREDIVKCEWLKNCQHQSIIDTQGFVWEKAKEGDFIRVQFSQTNHLHVDLFPFYSRNGTMTKDTWFITHKQDMEFPEHFLKPLHKIKFVGVRASIPNNYRAFLELKFGKGSIEKPEYPDPNILAFAKKV